MTRPQGFLIRMIIFVTVVTGLMAFLFTPLQSAFMANAPLNGLIAGVLILGIGLGAAIGLLSAQQSGSESRNAIKGRYQEWRAKSNGEESEEL